MYIIDLIKSALTEWSGRFSRKEYIIFLLGTWGITIGLLISISVITAFPVSSLIEIILTLLTIVFAIWYLVAMIATLGAAVRRLHDSDHSGWYILINLIPLINLIILYWLFIVPSNEIGETRWG